MPKHTPLPAQELLLKLFDYDPETGVIRHAVYKNSQSQAGELAGHLRADGYIDIKIDGRKFYTARIIWMMMTGEDPGDLYVDHIDRNRSNNRWSNLRLATRSQQSWNRCLASKGYCFDKQRQKWIVRVLINGKRVWGGRHATEEEAREAAEALRLKHRGEFCGEFRLA